ncbi:MAG: type II secretion system minor pseudopilin GspI [Gammaproteobacteria bacterium]|nr:type II secretion system minor pseudopilin GspI [Gammaproteobacteria bacterium]MCP4090497.1 type II secretion system minor pseudopilin GspI [Gammaproteobacteria bacterium]MCP4276638.1 type II secretion system minor pseudopilin GspI [Gammaproteobacteria bacterium]MCP4831388.1 type II secretion system minor pseudopilin GspI [Gammaproteobacteria bacterium]MCP4927932.1 type II secretion system minor pseudopilin GspI [Gammaproteobacteria bacterium]
MNSEQQQGFTLIEVLVALAIVIIAFMAMYGTMMQVVAATTLMQEKTIATWIAFDRITEMRVMNEFPSDNERNGELEMAGSDWVYSIKLNNAAGSENTRQVIVKVAPAQDPDNVLGLATGALVKPVKGSDGSGNGNNGITQ